MKETRASISHDAQRETLVRYLDMVGAGNLDGILDLMSDDVSVEDPVGGGPGTHVVGRENVRMFFSRGFARTNPRPTATGVIVTTANGEAAMPFRLRLTLGRRDVEIDVIDVVAFDDAGKIRSLRAFWNTDDMREVADRKPKSTGLSSTDIQQ